MTIKPNILSRAEAAEHLGVHPMTITRWVKAGKLKATRVNRRLMIRLADIEQMLADNPA